jgi:dimethylhistidine N-methyltransferase
MIVESLSVESAAVEQFAREVRAGLDRPGQKQLPSKYLYDEVGSSLFETICVLPEYGLTRADERLLRLHAKDLERMMPSDLCVAELGSGSGKKTRYVFEALCERREVTYYPIEISGAALGFCERELASIPGLAFVGVEKEYLAGLRYVSKQRQKGAHLLVLFLGSTIGNFDTGEDQRFLQQVRECLVPGDSLLLGADLVKPIDRLISAYDDPIGVTASFNLNLLARINRELGADFDLRSFEHVATFNQKTSSVEMHLKSRRRQTVTVERAEFMAYFAEGETIWTESSHKYLATELLGLAEASGFSCKAQWTDQEWCFTENLFIAQ